MRFNPAISLICAFIFTLGASFSDFNIYFLLLPYVFLCMFLFTVGVGLFLSCVSVFLRDVFYIYGRLLETPYKGTLSSGIHELLWTPNTLVSGVLVIRLTCDKTVLSVKALKKK